MSSDWKGLVSKSLAQVLRRQCLLTELNLGSSRIGTEDVRSLAGALEQCSSDS